MAKKKGLSEEEREALFHKWDKPPFPEPALQGHDAGRRGPCADAAPHTDQEIVTGLVKYSL